MNNCNTPPMVPAPRAPWAREVQSPLAQTLVDAAVSLALDPQVTYLAAYQSQAQPITYNLQLPPGNYPQQFKRLYIPTNYIAQTATWTITGTFAGGFTSLTFNSQGYAALLEWDGSGWQMIGGNAILNP